MKPPKLRPMLNSLSATRNCWRLCPRLGRLMFPLLRPTPLREIVVAPAQSPRCLSAGTKPASQRRPNLHQAAGSAEDGSKISLQPFALRCKFVGTVATTRCHDTSQAPTTSYALMTFPAEVKP